MKYIYIAVLAGFFFTSFAHSIELSISTYKTEQLNWSKLSKSDKITNKRARHVFEAYLMGLYEGFALMKQTLGEDDLYCLSYPNKPNIDTIINIIDLELNSKRSSEIPSEKFNQLPIGLVLLNGINSNPPCLIEKYKLDSHNHRLFNLIKN